jgi:tRNA (cytidine/uridine-2'-O-)-methyltransferase
MEKPVEIKSLLGKRRERHIVLVAPEIHWNTGNIGRTCLGTGSTLHLVKPMGFSLDSKHIRRAGLDYWPRVRLKIWESFEKFESSVKPDREEFFLFSKSGKLPFWSMSPKPRMFLVFGSETGGLPESIVRRYRERTYCIPINSDIRSLNLSTAAGIALYESLRTRPTCQHG